MSHCFVYSNCYQMHNKKYPLSGTRLTTPHISYEVPNGSKFLGKPYEPNAIIKNDIEFVLMQRKPKGYRKSANGQAVSSLSELRYLYLFMPRRNLTMTTSRPSTSKTSSSRAKSLSGSATEKREKSLAHRASRLIKPPIRSTARKPPANRWRRATAAAAARRAPPGPSRPTGFSVPAPGRYRLPSPPGD